MVKFNEVKAEYPIKKVVELLGIELGKRERNGQSRGDCPLCGETDRVFVITPSTAKDWANRFRCFKCDAKGDQLELIKLIRKCEVEEAARWLVGGDVKERVAKPAAKETSEFKELDYLVADHEDVVALGFEVADAKALGIGYAPRGMHQGLVAVPIYLSDGSLAGYIGLSEPPNLPPEWHLPAQNVVPLKRSS
jgi:phage/plasmid primase-like uncharacterized protein